MPARINFDDFDSLNFAIKRREYFVNLWRNIPATTDRIHPIPHDQLKAAYDEFLVDCGSKSPVPSLFAEIQETCGYPWSKGVNASNKRGQQWLAAFMFAAMTLHGFLVELKGGVLRPKVKSRRDMETFFEATRHTIQEQIIDDWLGFHDRIYADAREKYEEEQV